MAATTTVAPSFEQQADALSFHINVLLQATPVAAFLTLIPALIANFGWSSFFLTPAGTLLTIVLCARLLFLSRGSRPQGSAKLPPTSALTTIGFAFFTAAVYLAGLGLIIFFIAIISIDPELRSRMQDAARAVELVMVVVDAVLLIVLGVKCIQQRRLFKRNEGAWLRLDAPASVQRA